MLVSVYHLMPESEEFTTIQSVLDNADEYYKVNLKGKVFELHENRPNNTNLHLVSGLLVNLEATNSNRCLGTSHCISSK